MKDLSDAAVSPFKTERALMETVLEYIPIMVNDMPRQQPAGGTLASLLDDLHIPVRTGIAVAINDEVVRKADWSCRALKAHDRVLVISASQGG